MLDKIKLLFAVLLVVAGLAGFYFLPDLPTLVRVLMVLAGLVAGGVVAFFTTPGKVFFAFAGERAMKHARWCGRHERKPCRPQAWCWLSCL